MDLDPWFLWPSGEFELAVSSASRPAPWHCMGAVHLRPWWLWERVLRQETQNQAAKADLRQRHVYVLFVFILVCVHLLLKKINTREILLPFKMTNSAHFLPSGLPDRPKSPVEPKKEGESSTMYSSLPTSDAPENGRQTQVWLCFLTKIICTTRTHCHCHHSGDCFLVYH